MVHLIKHDTYVKVDDKILLLLQEKTYPIITVRYKIDKSPTWP